MFEGDISVDYYGRPIPKHAHGTTNLDGHSSSTKEIMEAVSELFDRIVAKNLLIRRLNVTANHVIDEANIASQPIIEQHNLFMDYEKEQEKRLATMAIRAKEKSCQKAILFIRKKYGPSAILMGMNLLDEATTIQRNNQIGGHRAYE